MEYYATKYRPKTFDDIVGQQHLAKKGASLRTMVESGQVFNLIFYGPPGCGKSTIANVIALTTNRKFVKLNAVDLSVKEIRAEIESDEEIILMIDEIHLLNKKQQQSLLEATETGKISLIGILSENPYFCLHNALLSRSIVFQFFPVQAEDIEQRLSYVIEDIRKENPERAILVEKDFLKIVAQNTNGDIRSALNILQIVITKKLALEEKHVQLLIEDLKDLSLKGYHDRDGDVHYNLLSAFHKSLRGSDENAAIHYLARLIKAGDIQSIIRRLLCVASEDVGLANPQAVQVVKACVDSALQLGFPEAQLPLAQATIFLAKQPKSNSAYIAIAEAMRDVETVNNIEVPDHLKDGHYAGAKKLNKSHEYKYPHDYPGHWVKQSYLPKSLSDRKYYRPGDNKTEKAYEEVWKQIKK